MKAYRALPGSRSLVAMGAITALLLTGCGGSEDGDQPAAGDAPGSSQRPDGQSPGGEPSAAGEVDLTDIGLVNLPEDVGEPVAGGTLDFAVYSEIRSLNPMKSSAKGTTGGSIQGAIYDVLLRYDAGTREYEPQLAKSMEPNEDFSVWTLKLREGVTFSDGTPLNADAVAWSINRYIEKSGTFSLILSETIANMKTPDPRTVVFTLTEPWTEFPYLFTFGVGNILAPSAVEGEEFTPIGAGPFKLERFASGEEVVLTAREDYWGGEPRLEKLRFVPIPGPQAKLDSLRSGGIDVAFLREEPAIVAALKRGRPGFLNVQNLGGSNIINNRQDHPGADVRIRKAIAYATNPDVISQRTAEGKGLFSKKLFQEWSTWTTEADPLPYDPAKAKALLAEAKADGYDGKITYSCYSTAAGKEQALAMQQLLEAVGFDVKLDLLPNVSAMVRKVYIDRGYDMTCWGTNTPEAAPWVRLSTSFHSDSVRNTTGYSNPEMDRLLHELKIAQSDEDRHQALNEIQKLWTETVPAVLDSATPEFLAWSDQVHDIVPTSTTIGLFHNAWIG